MPSRKTGWWRGRCSADAGVRCGTTDAFPSRAAPGGVLLHRHRYSLATGSGAGREWSPAAPGCRVLDRGVGGGGGCLTGSTCSRADVFAFPARGVGGMNMSWKLARPLDAAPCTAGTAADAWGSRSQRQGPGKKLGSSRCLYACARAPSAWFAPIDLLQAVYRQPVCGRRTFDSLHTGFAWM